jgi:uncharacterized protein
MEELPTEKILQIAKRHEAVDVRVFGSRARGDFPTDSDLDLLIKVTQSTSLLDLIGMEHALEDLLGIEVEVVTEGGLHPMLRDEILAEARPLVALRKPEAVLP